MPTARELLEQADALMRRNRSHAAAPRVATGAPDPGPRTEIPVLTDAVAVPPSEAQASVYHADGTVAPRPVLALDDVPVLTDAVEEIEAPTIAEAPDEGEPSRWLDDARGETSIIAPPPDSLIVVPPAPAFADAFEPSAHPVEADATVEPIDIHAPAEPLPEDALATEHVEPASQADAAGADTPVAEEPMAAAGDVDELSLDELEAPSAPSADGFGSEAPTAAAALASARALMAETKPPDDGGATADEDLRWDALAEEIRMQVLQRIDIFTDTGLREQLTERLQPIVDRASADLVATINQHVGQLIRSYVAEAIEREIEKWRQGGG